MCGSTRAIKLLSTGSIINSLKINPMAIIWLYLSIIAYLNLCTNTFSLDVFKKYRFLDIIYLSDLKFLKYYFVVFMILNSIYLNYNF